MADQPRQGSGRDRPGTTIYPVDRSSQEARRQDGDVFFPLPQRRHVKSHRVDPEVEVLPEAPGADQFLEVTVCREYETDVDLSALPLAEPAYLLLLQDAQKGRLEMDGKLSDLVEKEGAAARRLDQALAVADGSRKCPSHASEQLTLQQACRHLHAVHRDERAAAPRTERVYVSRDELLPRPALSAYQDVYLPGGDFPYIVPETNDLRGYADDRRLERAGPSGRRPTADSGSGKRDFHQGYEMLEQPEEFSGGRQPSRDKRRDPLVQLEVERNRHALDSTPETPLVTVTVPVHPPDSEAFGERGRFPEPELHALLYMDASAHIDDGLSRTGLPGIETQSRRRSAACIAEKAQVFLDRPLQTTLPCIRLPTRLTSSYGNTRTSRHRTTQDAVTTLVRQIRPLTLRPISVRFLTVRFP